MTREKNRDAGWAVFNIEADGNQFDFKVALGGTTTSFRDPASIHSVLNEVTDTKICRISIQRPTRARRGMDPKRLEVISPLHGNDELDLAAVCVQQLSTALRLYSPVSFSIVRWERLRASGLRPQSTERYILKGSQLRIFRSFSQRFLDFHVSRNLFRHARVLPEDLEDDVRTLLRGSREHEAHVLKEPHVMIAADLFEKASEGQSIAPELQLVLLIMAAEALFGTGDKSELAFRLSLRLAVLNGSSNAHRKELFEAVEAFTTRGVGWCTGPGTEAPRASCESRNQSCEYYAILCGPRSSTSSLRRDYRRTNCFRGPIERCLIAARSTSYG